MTRFLLAAVLIATVLHPRVLAAPVPLSKPNADSREELEQAWDKVGWYRPYAVKFWCRIQADPKEGYAFLDRVIEPIEMSEVKPSGSSTTSEATTRRCGGRPRHD